jgi:predicted transcriptional regulator
MRSKSITVEIPSIINSLPTNCGRGQRRSRIIRVARALRDKRTMSRNHAGKQNLTISVSPETLRRARILAAQRSTSISGMLAEQLEKLVAAEQAWERAERAALALLEQAFPLGGVVTVSRDELHER